LCSTSNTHCIADNRTTPTKKFFINTWNYPSACLHKHEEASYSWAVFLWRTDRYNAV
jgi:hypothetical protein